MPVSPARRVGRMVAALVLLAGVAAWPWEPWAVAWAALVAWAFGSQGEAD